jgi:hypothetical protein
MVVSLLSARGCCAVAVLLVWAAESSAASMPGDGAAAKISSIVVEAAGSIPSGRGASSAPSFVRSDTVGRIQVRVQLRRLDDDVLARLASAGMQVEIHNARLSAARGWIDPGRLPDLAAIDDVLRITPPDYRQTNAGAVEGEHDVALGCQQTRTNLGIDGSGVRLGVISDGINSIASSQSSGDAPVVIVPDEPRCHMGDGDEGSAMIEIIHDCAPGAEIGFCGPLDDLEMVECVRCLSETFGADVIVDDLGFVQQPFFEDGAVAVAVRDAVASGVSYFSAAGNYAQSHYQGTYLHCPDTSTRHDFGGGDCTLGLVFSGDLLIVLEWDEPFGAASSDYDLCVTGESCSSGPQDGDDDPIEAVAISCDRFSCSRELEISRFSGVDHKLEMYFFSAPGGGVGIEHDVPTDSIFGHPCVEGAVTVGAINVSDAGTDRIEAFSSRGPCTILGAGERPKPDVCGVDGISNTRPGGFPSPFFGTSASAPGIAAVGALLLQFDPSLTSASILDTLRGTSVDLGSPGFDFTFGAGRVEAVAAFAVITPPPTATPTPGVCFGDCDQDGGIEVTELVTAVRIALGTATAASCPALDANGDGVKIDDVVRAVNASVFRCVAGARQQ